VSAHETLGTRASGLVRISFGAFNTKGEIDKLCDALGALVEKGKSAV
jgi:selenocysteine lyase/cysteine desulfurase